MNKLEHLVKMLVDEALAEDEREGGHFDAIGFAQFFPEDSEFLVRRAWSIYDQIVRGGKNDHS